MIEVRGLGKKFGSRQVLDDVSICLEPGQITALAGPNGCGKTTLLKCILGLTVPTSGQVFIGGKERDPNGNYRREISYMPQYPDFPAGLKLREILKMIADLRGSAGIGTDDLISYFSLEDSMDKSFGQLSGGMKQKFAAVIAMMFETPVLILDEPTAGLDPLSNLKFKDLLLRKKNEGKTILLVSHFMTEIQQIANDLIFVQDGAVAYSGEIGSLLRKSGELDLERALAGLFRKKDGNE